MSPRARILIAEDDLGVRDLVRTRLVAAGFDCHTARTGAEALSRLIELRPAALVLDINMPELDGFLVLKAMAAHHRRVPTLVLSARHAADDVRRALALGAKDYLSKPFNEAQLLARVTRLLRPPLPVAPARPAPVADSVAI